MSRFVVDSSVALGWCFSDETDPLPPLVLQLLRTNEAMVPATWPLEVANVLAIAERTGRIDLARSTLFLDMLAGLPILVDDQTATRALSETLSLARRFQLTAYDAAYLELAIRQGLSLATLDQELSRAAQLAGVALFGGP